MSAGMIISEAHHESFMAVLVQLSGDANAKLCFLLDRAGQQIASTGEMTDVDPTSLASLTAGNVAATEGVAQLVGESEFSTLIHEGRHGNLHISLVGRRVILLVVFDERSSLGLVRLRVDQHMPELARIAHEVEEFAKQPGAVAGAVSAAFSEITEDDIDALFG